MLYEKYLNILKYIIEQKFKENKNNNNELKLYNEFIINNENRINKKYFRQLKILESKFNVIEEKKMIK